MHCTHVSPVMIMYSQSWQIQFCSAISALQYFAAKRILNFTCTPHINFDNDMQVAVVVAPLSLSVMILPVKRLGLSSPLAFWCSFCYCHCNWDSGSDTLFQLQQSLWCSWSMNCDALIISCWSFACHCRLLLSQFHLCIRAAYGLLSGLRAGVTIRPAH